MLPPETLAKAQSLLAPAELDALQRVSVNPSNRLTPVAAASFFRLFLQGYSCADIAKQNPAMGTLALGLIVRARIEYDWDAERDRHVRGLMAAAAKGVETSTLEAIQFSADAMAVYHRLVGDKFRKYLQTGNPEELGEFKTMTFKAYKDFVVLFQSLTGEDAPAPVTVNVNQEHADVSAADNPAHPDAAVASSEDAAAMLKYLVGKGKS